MTTPAAGQPCNYRFADLTLDVARRCVERNGQPIDLKALDFDLLRFLVEQAPNVVNADVLAEKVWGRHFVSPENVAQRVMLLRQSLSDDANKPRYIETVRNKGYRLTPVVERLPAQTPRATRQRSRWLLPAATAVVLLSGITALSVYWLGATAEQAAPGPKAVAVLAFENLSPDPDDKYFAEGMQGEIVNQLTKIKGLRVIPMLPDDYRARDLNIVATLGGSVSYSQGRVRVMPRLTETATGVTLWSSSYQRELSDIFAIQSEIALDVARALRLELSDSERERIERVPTVDPRARNLYLKARVWQSRTTREDLLLAIADIEEALEIDDKFTEAWILDANARSVAQIYDPVNVAEHRARGERAARRAIELDPESAGAYAALGLELFNSKNWKESEAVFRKARSLEAPPDVSGYCLLELAAGKFAVARDLIEKGRDDQPQNPTVHRFMMFTYAALGEWARATELYDSGMEMFKPWRQGPNNWMHWLVGHGDLAEARKLPMPIDDALSTKMLSLEAREAIEELRRSHLALGAGNPNLRRDIGLWAGHFGDTSLALEAMRAAIDEQGGPQVVYIWLPQLAQMRQMPEFKSYLREIGMVDYWKEYGWPDICRPLEAGDFECD